MNETVKAIITPIVAFIGLIIQLFFGIDLSDEQLTIISDGFIAFALALTTIAGVFRAYKEKKDKKEKK